MKRLLLLARRLRELEVVRYIFIGGLSFVTEITFLYFLTDLEIGAVTSVAISFWVGLVVAFILQKTIAFRDQRKEPGVITKQIGIYLCLVGFNYMFTLLFVQLTQDFMQVYTSRTMVILITTIWNFYIYKVMFKKTTPP